MTVYAPQLASALAFLLLLTTGGCAGVGHSRATKPAATRQAHNRTTTSSSEIPTRSDGTLSETSCDTQTAVVHAASYAEETFVEEAIVEEEPEALPAAPSTLTLADIERIALGNNPAIIAANLTANMASGFRQQVGVRPNPTFGYWGSQLADKSTGQNGAFINQQFVRGDKLALNRKVLGHTLNAQRWEAETQRYRVLTDVRIRFFEALASQRQLEATLQFAKVAQRGVEVAVTRQDANEGTTIEVLQSKTLMSEIKLAQQQTQAAYLGAWKDLAAVAGTPDLTPVTLTADFDLPDGVPDWETAYFEITDQSPELAAAKALVCEKQANLRRQQSQPIPNFNVQLQSGYDQATDSGLINLQVGAPIPLANKNSGNIAAAFSDYKRALEHVRRIELGIKLRLARAAQEYESAHAAVGRYEQEIVPQARQTLDLSEEAYRAGELDFLQVLVVRRVYYQATIKLIAAEGRLAQATSKVDGLLLVGGLDAPQDYTNGDSLRGQSLGGQ